MESVLMIQESEIMASLMERVARLETGQNFIAGLLGAVAVPIYWQFINSIARKFSGREKRNW